VSIRETPGIHADEAALLALLDEESTAEEGEALRGHLASCDRCAARFETLQFTERRARAGLELLDAPTPFSEMPVALRVASSEAVTPIRTAARSGRRLGQRSVATAAGLILFLAAAAYAVPGSPVRTLVARSANAIADLFRVDQGPADPGPSEVSVDPVGGFLRISIFEASADLRITVRTTPAARASVSAREAEFGVESGEIQVRDAAGDMVIALPTASESVVEVNGVVVARLREGLLAREDGADASPATIIVETGG